MDKRQQYPLAAQKANHILGCIKSSMASRLMEVILCLYCGLVRPDLEVCIQPWGPQHKKAMDLLREFQRKATKMVRKAGLGPFNLEKKILLGDLIGAFQYIKSAYKKDGETFNQAYSGRTGAKEIFYYEDGETLEQVA